MRDEPAAIALFNGGGATNAALRALDWSATALGPVAHWPPELRCAASICVHSDFQLAIAWGPEFVYIYNEAASSLFADKHPWALGRAVAEVWPEIWPTVGPMLESVRASGKATRSDDLELMLEFPGRVEETYITFSYSPIFLPEGTVGGVFIAFMDTTGRVLAERRQRIVAGLASQVALRERGDDSLARVRAALGDAGPDLPLVALVQPGADGAPRLVLCTGVQRPLEPARARQVAAWAGRYLDAPEPLLAAAAPLLDLAGACGPWQEQPRQMLVMPFGRGRHDAACGVLLMALNPRTAPDTRYRDFLDSIAGHISHAVTLAESEAAERRRIEALAELDRSRSQFFTNASHELRTPLTLIMGPLDTMLEREGEVPPALREPLEMAQRNAQRLHKLVNSLLDFARIEAGQLPPALEAIDPCASAAEIAALFRSAVEAAGLALTVRCEEGRGAALLDRDMWEKIVFNLLSNAFKYTHAGGIEMAVGREDGWLVLRVSDTGIGIAADEVGRVFERFYRSTRAAGRSAEGSGVGLALVQELARLHGGDVAVDSEAGAGARFTVRLPWRAAEGGAATLRQVRTGFTDEVRRYGMRANADGGALHPAGPQAPMTAVVVDDDADVVRYIERLLGDSCRVVAARDAEHGLAAVRASAPDLVLVDVMLPGADGLELVRRIRAERPIQTVSVLVLSARAGEEARLDALDAGADDYLVKPFSGRELIARVRSHVQMVRLRRTALEQEGVLLRQIEAVRNDLAGVLDGTSDTVIFLDRELRVQAMNEAAVAATGLSRAEAIGRPLPELRPGVAGSALEHALRGALTARAGITVDHFQAETGRWFEARCYPAPQGAMLFASDITDRKEGERALRETQAALEWRVEERTRELRMANQLLAAVFDRAPGGIAISDGRGRLVHVNAAYAELTGVAEAQLAGRALADWIEPAGLARLQAGAARLLAGECAWFEAEVRYRRPAGGKLWVSHFVSLLGPAWHGERCFVTIARDITRRKRDEAERQAAQGELRVLYERLQTVRENERKALAREVHDQLGQILSAAKIDIKLLEDGLRPGAEMVRERIVAELGSASATIERAIVLVREIATELRAPELDEQGLYTAIAWHVRDFERRTRIACHVTFEPARPHPNRAAAAALLGILQEAMTNVLRHAQASKVWVSLERRGTVLVLRVRDDGVGIARPGQRRGGALGLQGMHERAELVDGSLLIGSLRPRGTLVAARVPLMQRRGRQ
ncbi:ATP-binding protein [Massilia niastensis]|uniref:ATP-binding protein n=1 Tax=Massilia niastensis TaxID=544911 RepID=UPI000371A681|nr:ATP-binding protein [Massilia niastensis]